MSLERALADLTRAQTQSAALRAELGQIEERIRKLQTFIEMAKEYGVASDPAAESVTSLNEHSGTKRSGLTNENVARPRRPPASGVSKDAVDHSVAILREVGTPLHTKELLSRLAARGVHIGGTNPVTNLSGFLSRSNQLLNSRKFGWSLASREVSGGDDTSSRDDAAQQED